MMYSGKNSIFGTVKQAISRGLATALFLGASFSATAGDTFVINKHGEVTLSTYEAKELASSGGIQMVVSMVDSYGVVTDTFVVEGFTGSGVDVDVNDPEGFVEPGVDIDDTEGFVEPGVDIDDAEGFVDPSVIVDDPEGKRALATDAITITIPASTTGPVVLIVDGKVMIVPTN